MDLFCYNNRVRTLKNNLNIDVNYFQNRRWQLVTLLEQLSGFWPYQSKLKQYTLQTIHFFAISSVLLAVVNKLQEFMGSVIDIEMIIECSLTMMFLICLLIKLTLASMLQKTRQKIYEQIAEHYEKITDPEEVRVLEDCADQGFKYTATYVCIVCVVVGIFDSAPVLRSFYSYYFDHYELKIQLPIQLDYGFDHKKYWYIVMLDFLMFVFSGILVDVAYDLSFILQIRHIQALFKIIGMRLDKASELVGESENEIVSEDDDEESYSKISSAIDLHSEALELVKLIEETYTVNWFVILLINTAFFGAGIHLISLRWHDSVETFRNLCVFFLLLMHFFVIFSQGQNIIDSSSKISYACYDCKWYYLPKKSCKLLITMMIRTSTPCIITGAQLFPLSMETFSKMLKAGISYYTVFQT